MSIIPAGLPTAFEANKRTDRILKKDIKDLFSAIVNLVENAICNGEKHVNIPITNYEEDSVEVVEKTLRIKLGYTCYYSRNKEELIIDWSTAK